MTLLSVGRVDALAISLSHFRLLVLPRASVNRMTAIQAPFAAEMIVLGEVV